VRSIIIFLLSAAFGWSQSDNSEMRYSVSLTDEGEFAAGLRVPGADTGNLLLLEPTFAYKSSDFWRFSTSLAAVTTTQGETQSQLRVRETYFGIDAGDLDLTIGKRLLRWGTGYAFTVTGILDPPRNPTDPTDRLNLNEGREMATADWVSGRNDVTVAWASAGLFGKRQPGMLDTAAIRYNVLVDGFDTSVIVAHEGSSTFSGANFTRVFGEAVELHGEFGWSDTTGAGALIGGKYTTRSGVTAIAEFYTPASAERQQYGFVRVGKSRLRERPGWKEWDVTLSLVTNLGDGSRIAVLDAGRRFGKHFYAYTHTESPSGKRNASEFGAIPYSALASIGVTFQL